MKKGIGFAVLLFVVGGLAGVVFSGAFASFIQYSNTLGFCISCHEMESTVYQEYKTSLHYRNPVGVRAICSDCHVPHGNWIQTVLFKVAATKELFYHFAGAVDTKAKFEAKRKELAEGVWAYMKATDSRTCRNCHSWSAMELAKQRKSVRVEHESAQKEGQTCIDCHKGLVHKPVQEKKEEPGGAPSFQLQ